MIKVDTTKMTSPADIGSDHIVDILPPTGQIAPIVFASPHSGRDYTKQFLRQSALALPLLRSSEDAFVDRLFAQTPQMGATQVIARFPRAFVDVNRAPEELDPAMFDGGLPPGHMAKSPRVAAGLGAVPRLVAEGTEIYDTQLPAGEAQLRIDRYHTPYHAALRQQLETLRARFGLCVLIDCHSMPSRISRGQRSAKMDVVLGDRFGAACAPWIIDQAQHILTDMGLAVVRNTPYAGGYCTDHYGQPSEHMHAIQIEINRALYLDEKTIEPNANFDNIRQMLARFAAHMVEVARQAAP